MIAAALPASTTAASPLGAIDQLLRDRDAMLARIAAGRDLAAITRAMIATIAIAMAIVGAALGSYRGGDPDRVRGDQAAAGAARDRRAVRARADRDRRGARPAGAAARRTSRS